VTTRPRPPERLEKTLARVARDQGIDQERLRRWVSFLAICGVLERAASEGILGGYYLKGGVAMELRFAQRARATKDLDLVLNGDRGKRLRSSKELAQNGARPAPPGVTSSSLVWRRGDAPFALLSKR
jgi:hypothetical protein